MDILDNASIAAFVSIIVSLIIQIIFRICDSRRQKENLKAGLVLEIKSILDIIKKRQYKKYLISNIGEMQKGQNINLIQVKISDRYNVFYISNIDKIILLCPQFTRKIMQFHMLIESLILDIDENGILSDHNNATVENYQECLNLLNQIISIGEDLTK